MGSPGDPIHAGMYWVHTAATGRQRAGFTAVEIVLVVAILGLLAAIAIPMYRGYRERLAAKQAITDIRMLEGAIERSRAEYGHLPNTLLGVVEPVPLDPWGNPYQYLNLQAGLPGTAGKRRKDKNLNPINSDYDLYSKGPDGESSPQLVAAKSRDDIVRAADGDFVGIAQDY